MGRGAWRESRAEGVRERGEKKKQMHLLFVLCYFKNTAAKGINKEKTM